MSELEALREKVHKLMKRVVEERSVSIQYRAKLHDAERELMARRSELEELRSKLHPCLSPAGVGYGCKGILSDDPPRPECSGNGHARASGDYKVLLGTDRRTEQQKIDANLSGYRRELLELDTPIPYSPQEPLWDFPMHKPLKSPNR